MERSSRPGKTPEAVRTAARQRIARIQEQIRAVDYLCSGTLVRRTKLCGKAGCRCAQDPTARHGPYHEWGRMQGGKLVHRMVSPEQAKIIREAIANYRRVRRLLRRWEAQTTRVIEAEKPHK